MPNILVLLILYSYFDINIQFKKNISIYIIYKWDQVQITFDLTAMPFTFL